jgi:hypothetical protein
MKMIGWITLVSSAFVSFAVAQEAASPAAPKIAGKPADAAFPFVASATANDVYVRSGRGPGYYHCGKVNTGDQVTVVEDAGGWAKILPLAEHYSWIHKNYVKLNPQTPRIGTVTGDNVRIWAGSDFIEPIRSSSLQTRLNPGEIVELFDTSQSDTGDYYKIKSPSGAYLWISSEYLKYVGPVKPVEPIEPVAVPVPPKAEPQTLEERLGVEATAAAVPVVETPAPVEPVKAVEEVKPEPPKPVTPSKETLFLQQCYSLSEKINEELKKPLKEQDYSLYKEQIAAILGDAEAGKASIYATFLMERIDRYELAIGVTQTLKKQEDRLDTLRAQIEKAHQAQLDKIPTAYNIPLYTGTVKPSFVYTGTGGQKRFLLTDNTGRILCYMLPAGPEIQGRLEQLISQEISVRGTIISDPKALVTLISVTSIHTKE